MSSVWKHSIKQQAAEIEFNQCPSIIKCSQEPSLLTLHALLHNIDLNLHQDVES